VPRASFGSLLLATGAVAFGLPAYALLQRWGNPPPSLLDRPWPLELTVALLVLGTAYSALRASKGWPRRFAVGGLLCAAASLAALIAVAARDLPAPSPEVALGRSLGGLDGARGAEIRLRDELGQPFSLASLHGHPALFVFYRGALCVACRAQLSALGERAAPFIAAGVRVLGISADPPSVSAEWRRTLGLPFPLLSDERQSLVQDLCSARAHCLVLADPAGTTRWGALNEYWRGAERPEDVLLAAYRLRTR
jgi:peroxiredoxin